MGVGVSAVAGADRLTDRRSSELALEGIGARGAGLRDMLGTIKFNILYAFLGMFHRHIFAILNFVVHACPSRRKGYQKTTTSQSDRMDAN